MKNRFYLSTLVLLWVVLFTSEAFAQPTKVMSVNSLGGEAKVNYVNGFDGNNPAKPQVIHATPTPEDLDYAASFGLVQGEQPRALKMTQRPVEHLMEAQRGPVEPMFAAYRNYTRQSMSTPVSGCEASDIANSGFIPPDPHGTVGTNHALFVNNVNIQAFAKDCTPSADLGLQSLQTFFGAATSTFDPKARWDHFDNRYVVVTLELVNTGANPSPANESRILIAASPVGTVAGAWNSIAIDSKIQPGGAGTAESWCDYPGFAVDEEAIYVTCNYFQFTTFAFLGTRQWVLNKSTLYAGTFNPATDLFFYDIVTATANPCGFTQQPAHVQTNPGGTVGTWFGSYNSCSGGGNEAMIITRMNNPLGGAGMVPTMSIQFMGNITDLPAFPNAPQPGGVAPLNTGGTRTFDAVYDDGELFVTTSIVPNVATSPNDVGEASAIFAEFAVTATTTAFTRVVVMGGENIDAGAHTYYPSIAVNDDVVLTAFAGSSPNHFGGAYYARFDRMTNTVGPTEIMREGRDSYVLNDGGGRNRWGDYTGAALDPVDDSFWLFNEYAQETAGNGAWGQYVLNVDNAGTPTPPANNTIAGALLVDVTPFNDATNTNAASSEAGEAQPTCVSGGNEAGNSIWYTYTPASAGNADFTVTGTGDYVLSVHTGAAHPLAETACADANGHNAGESLTTIAVTAGTSYLVRIAEFGAATSAPRRGDTSNQGSYSSALQAVGLNIAGPAPAALPVELVSFTSEVDGTDVLISWETETETNNAGFEIQRLTQDREAFEILGFVDGMGTTLETQNYSFFIDNETPGLHTYRLKQIDLDGSFEFSNSIETDVEVPNGIWLGAAYPNPFNPTTNFSVVVDLPQKVTVEVFDYLGKRVALLFEGSLDARTAKVFKLDARDLTSGTYFYSVRGSESSTLTKSVVLMK